MTLRGSQVCIPIHNIDNMFKLVLLLKGTDRDPSTLNKNNRRQKPPAQWVVTRPGLHSGLRHLAVEIVEDVLGVVGPVLLPSKDSASDLRTSRLETFTETLFPWHLAPILTPGSIHCKRKLGHETSPSLAVNHV